MSLAGNVEGEQHCCPSTSVLDEKVFMTELDSLYSLLKQVPASSRLKEVAEHCLQLITSDGLEQFSMSPQPISFPITALVQSIESRKQWLESLHSETGGYDESVTCLLEAAVPIRIASVTTKNYAIIVFVDEFATTVHGCTYTRKRLVHN